MKLYVILSIILCFSCTILAQSLNNDPTIEFGPKNLKDPMEEIHVLSLYYLLGFMVLHFGGVLLAECTTQKGLISRVISGNKKE